MLTPEDCSFRCYLRHGGDFVKALCEAIIRADQHNKERLRRAFPQVVAAHDCHSWDIAPPGFAADPFASAPPDQDPDAPMTQSQAAALMRKLETECMVLQGMVSETRSCCQRVAAQADMFVNRVQTGLLTLMSAAAQQGGSGDGNRAEKAEEPEEA